MNKQSRLAFARCRKIILKERAEGEAVNLVNAAPCSLLHLLWMIEECTTTKMPKDKYSRWLGYIQGCLVSQGLTTVEDERNALRK